MNHQEINELLAAYAVHALESDETVIVEAHLVICETCRTELDELHATASMLGTDLAAPPDGIWQRIESRIEAVTPVNESARVFPLRNTAVSKSAKRSFALTAAAAVIAIVSVSSAFFVMRDEPSPADDLALAAQRAIATPGAQQMNLRSNDGSLQANAVMLPSGNGYVTNVNLPTLPAGRTYQLWVLHDSHPVSAGLLGAKPDIAAFAAPGSVAGIAITDEPEAGSVAPTTPPLVSALV